MVAVLNARRTQRIKLANMKVCVPAITPADRALHLAAVTCRSMCTTLGCVIGWIQSRS